MREQDPLQSLLRDWDAPEPPPAMDARIRAAYRAVYPPSPWRLFWHARVSLPAPALAALLLIVIALFLEFRPVPAPASLEADRGYVTRLDATGFQPLPNGAARVVAVERVQQ